ncbi:PAR3 protein, partial [Centropus bengalensis]|nr:PAR3 protein [Centropus bengalensis]
SYHLLGNHWPFGERLCRATVAFFYGNMYSSIVFLTCIGLERYIALAHPFLWKGSSWARCKASVCAAVWLAVGLLVSPLLWHPQTRHIASLNVTACHDVLVRSEDVLGTAKDQHTFFVYYFLSLVGLGFGLPFVLMVVSYGCILARLLAKGRRYRQVVRVMALVLLVFTLCFTPSNALLLTHYLKEATGCNNLTYAWYTLALALAALNNLFDPFVYFYVSRDFRGWMRAAGSCCSGGATARRSLGKAALPLRSSQQSQ